MHVLVVDLFPPGRYDPHGMHAVIKQRLVDADETYDLPEEEPVNLSSYAAGPKVDMDLEYAVSNVICL